MSKGMTNSMEINEPFYVRRRPDPIPFRKFLYNDEKGTVMGRTGTSWGKWMLSVIIHKKKIAIFKASTASSTNTIDIQVWYFVLFTSP